MKFFATFPELSISLRNYDVVTKPVFTHITLGLGSLLSQKRRFFKLKLGLSSAKIQYS